MNFKRTCGVVAMAAIAAVGYGDDAVVVDGAEQEIEGTGAIAQGALDLSEGWTVSDRDPISVPYSAVGWDVEEDGTSGWAVTLELTPVGGGDTSVVASGLTGRGTNTWDTGSVRDDAYVLRHYVRKNGTDEPIKMLEAYFVFDRSSRSLETLAEVAAAVFPNAGRSCAVMAMGGASWMAVGMAGDGINGPAAGTATLTFAPDGIGSFAFEYRCAAGETLTVAVDGGAEQTLATAEDWTVTRFVFGDNRVHTVVFSAAGGGTAVRCVRWDDGSASGGAVARHALDLSDIWDKRNVNDEPILWSSRGWGDVAEESGKSVTLQLIPLLEGETQTLGSGLKGLRQTYIWAPGDVTKQVYNIKHSVVGGSPLETVLNAYFSFVNYDSDAPSAMDVHAAIRSDDGMGLKYGIANDTENWWTLMGGLGEGIAAPKGESSFKITVEGSGHLSFDYVCIGGTWTVKVDGVAMRTMEGAADWMGADIPMDGALVTHVIEFATNLSGGDSAALRNVRWIDADDCFGSGRVGSGSVDLREGVLVVRRANELMPFMWSSTNFTGSALVKNTGFISIDPQSVASVRVVQVTGEDDDPSQWTTEVVGTERTLVAERQGEGMVKWRGVNPGVWKAELVITSPAGEAYRETRILDLRNYIRQGLLLFVM